MLFQGIFLSLLQCPKAKIYNLINFLEEILHSLGENIEHSSSWIWKMREAVDMKVHGPQFHPGKSRGVSLIRRCPRNLHGVQEAFWNKSFFWNKSSWMSQARKRRKKDPVAGWHVGSEGLVMPFSSCSRYIVLGTVAQAGAAK